MLELRYNGCSGCYDSATKILTETGFFKGLNYKVVFHDDHKGDAIYKARPDYLEIFSGAILYNPDTGHWVDFYTRDHTKLALQLSSSDDVKKINGIFTALASGA